MVYYVKPEYGVDTQKLLMDTLGAFRGVKGMQREEKQFQTQQEDRQRLQQRWDQQQAREEKQGKRQDIKWQQEQTEFQQEQEDREKKQQKEFSAEFAQERAETAALMRGKTPEEKVRILQARIERLTEQKKNPDATKRLLNMYQAGIQGKKDIETARDQGAATEAFQRSLQIKAADERIEEAYQTGIMQGRIPAAEPQKDATPTDIKVYKWAFDPANKNNQAAQALRKKLELQGVPSGMRLETDKEGNVTFVSGKGVGEAPKMSKPMIGALQKKQADNMVTIAGLENSLSLMDEDFLTYKGKIKGLALPVIEKAGIGLSKEDKQFIDKYTKFRSSSLEDLSKYMNAISGAAVSEKEVKRLQKVIANPEDSPTEYVAKVKSVVDKLKTRNRIYNDLLREGFAAKGEATVAEVEKRLSEGYQPSAVERIKDLQKKNLSKEEIFQIIRAEGYK
jgi:hypothetical protein